MRFRPLTLCLLAVAFLTSASVRGQEKTRETSESPPKDPPKPMEVNGVAVTTRITTPDGKPVELDASPVKVIQRQGPPGQPNSVEFRFEREDGTNVFTQNERNDERPTTMRQTRIGDYRTDGVLFAGEMWRSMKKWGVEKMVEPMKLSAYRPDQEIRKFAESHELTIKELQLLNPLVEVESLRFETPLCVEMTHRVLPGEDLGFLAALYQTNESTLRELNSLRPGESVLWRKLRVPAVVELGRSGLA
ncbi:MAG: LysM peptidoglycan-binding domain-containing protein, partial [Planctomycetota bacterium]